jgi:predicted RNA-binding protein with RPS1 domain
VVKDIRDYVKVWEEVTAKIINFEPTKKRIGLSLKALQEAPKNPVKKPVEKWEEDKIDDEVAETKKKPAAKKKEDTSKKEVAETPEETKEG